MTEEENSLGNIYVEEDSKPAINYTVDLEEESISDKEVDDLLNNEMSMNHLTRSVSKMTGSTKTPTSEYSLDDKSPFKKYQYMEDN